MQNESGFDLSVFLNSSGRQLNQYMARIVATGGVSREHVLQFILPNMETMDDEHIVYSIYAVLYIDPQLLVMRVDQFLESPDKYVRLAALNAVFGMPRISKSTKRKSLDIIEKEYPKCEHLLPPTE